MIRCKTNQGYNVLLQFWRDKFLFPICSYLYLESARYTEHIYKMISDHLSLSCWEITNQTRRMEPTDVRRFERRRRVTILCCRFDEKGNAGPCVTSRRPLLYARPQMHETNHSLSCPGYLRRSIISFYSACCPILIIIVSVLEFWTQRSRSLIQHTIRLCSFNWRLIVFKLLNISKGSLYTVA